MAGDDASVNANDGSRAVDRVVALSDGVFAIAMTLLVLNLRVPAGTTGPELAHALRGLTREFGAYALSFAVIGLFWLGHRRLYAMVRRVDETIALLNLVQLGLVALIPFPTELIGTYGDQFVAAAAYAGIIGAAGIVGAGTCLHVLHADLALPRVSRDALLHGMRRNAQLAVIFLTSIPIALWSVSAAEWWWSAFGVAHVVAGLRSARRTVF